MNDRKFRDDITCPKSGEKIPLAEFSCSKWSDNLYFIYCPACGAFHQFVVTGEG